jgi:hypothetical protein
LFCAFLGDYHKQRAQSPAFIAEKDQHNRKDSFNEKNRREKPEKAAKCCFPGRFRSD